MRQRPWFAAVVISLRGTLLFLQLPLLGPALSGFPCHSRRSNLTGSVAQATRLFQGEPSPAPFLLSMGPSPQVPASKFCKLETLIALFSSKIVHWLCMAYLIKIPASCPGIDRRPGFIPQMPMSVSAPRYRIVSLPWLLVSLLPTVVGGIP